ncbi:DNA repair protein RadA [Nanchangia anserum]|uniref:DNA repair protein RadA n=1 Tax=Nanchangia anserum TaxID=2692125 RepID=A0A8I0GE27_9ACTO|nr:DNA repair protein RadA [Nanchangia anserum]MBD3689823.1 DNA repair protein RadA [Nanchangia anserum]QOX81993.1 DNA repair protein RadA [Nanchangia anserum]
MAKTKSIFRCTNCGTTYPKWAGQCRSCKAWQSLEEDVVSGSGAPSRSAVPLSPALPIGQVDAQAAQARSTGVSELDRVLGGGMVPGAVVLLAGEPGIGKSTLLLDVAAKAAERVRASSGGTVLYLTGEESASQVRLRAERIGALDPGLLLAAENDLSRALGHIEAHAPALVVVDSVQTLASPTEEGSPGGVTQVRAVAGALIAVAKQRNIPVLLVGHVTKSGNIAGPRVLEHLVDVVLHFEGDRHTRLRLLRAVKNRYGPTDEVGCFELADRGILGLEDPSGLFLSQTSQSVPGTCVTVTLEGRRPMPTEVQALVAKTSAGSPRRTTSGVDSSRVAMILAVLQARLGVDLSSCDVYASTVGGARTAEPAADLALAMSIVSAASDAAPKERLVAIGEVSLTGEVRQTVGIERRLAEAQRLGFAFAIVPRGALDGLRIPAGMTVRGVGDLSEAARLALPGITPGSAAAEHSSSGR